MLESNQPETISFDPEVDPAVFGGSVAGAGDVNGDGFDDVIVGARGWDNGLADEGAAFVFLGSATGIVGTDPAAANAVILGNQSHSEFGTSVAGAGDVNGDGFSDIIVGAPFYLGTFRDDPTLSVLGAAFVYYGGPSGIVGTDPITADVRIDANQSHSILGFSVAGAGDVNGDGFEDIIVGAPWHGSPTFPPNIPPNDGQGLGGAAVVFHGSAAGITATGFDDADAIILPYPEGFPEPSTTLMGTCVSGAGDVNGDGFDDILVSANGDSFDDTLMNANGAVLFLGSAAGIVGTDPTTAHTYISGPGVVVSGAGDVNGDGFGDIILGAPGFTEASTFAVFLGSPVGITATDFSQAQTIAQGVQTWRVAAAGDIDSDGFDDVIVGVINYVGSLNSEGAAYVFRGGPSGIVASSELDAYVRLESNQSEAVRRSDRVDFGVAGAGDVNGDGFADVILGFAYYDVDQVNEGAVFLYHGGPAPINPPNQPPVANAGADQAVVDVDDNDSELITVDGSLSFDPDGVIVSYAWLEGETLLGTSPVLTTALSTTGDHTLVLTVTDDGGITRGDAVTVRVDLVDSVQVLFDDFAAGFGDWVIGGDATLSSIDTFPSPPQLRIGASGSFLSRSIAMPVGSTGMTVSFWGKASLFAALDELLVKVSVDGGPFTTIHTITSAESNNTYIFYGGSAIPLGLSWFPSTASNIVLEFEFNMTTGLFFVDDVLVRALQAPLTNQPPIANAGADQTVTDTDGNGVETVTLDGTASSDPDGTIVSYEWREGATTLGVGSTVGVSFGVGAHTVTLTVTDNGGAFSSDDVLVMVNSATPSDTTPPTVSVTNPAGGATVFGTVTISASALDNVGVTAVELYLDSQLFSTDTTAPYSTSWDTTIVPDGSHALSAKALDAAGNEGTSPTVNVIVQNALSSSTTTTTFSDRLRGGATNTHNLTIDVTGTVDMNLTWDDDRADPFLTIFDPNNSVVVSQGGAQPIQVSFTATITGVYVFQLQNLGNRKADYDLQITHPVGSPPPSDTAAPTVIVTSPAAGSTVEGTVTIAASAWDNDTVTQVQFFVNGVLLSSDISVPYVATWDTTTMANGAHTITAQATDLSSNVGSSAPANVTVDNGAAPPDTTPPTTSITGPAVGATVSASITISATASDDVGVTQVQFFVDGVLLSTDTTGPYSASWNTTSALDGAHSLAAEASDAAGNSATSAAVNVTVDNIAPAVNITSPAAGATVSATVTITADASDSSGVTQVQFFVDGALLSSDSTAPYSASWDTTATANGAHSLSAQATDGQGSVGASETVNVTVSNVDAMPPTVNITSPTNGATVGGTITISAAASDNEVVTQVQFFVDGVLLSMDMTAPYSASWNTTPAADGVHSLTAEASDAAGNTGTSAVINVTVDNSTPPAPELSLSLSGVPASIDRGDEFTATATVTNTGAPTATGLTVTVSWSPGQMLRLENPQNPTQSVGSVAPGSSSSVSWLFRGDKEGSGTITFTLEDSGGATVDAVTQSITVIK